MKNWSNRSWSLSTSPRVERCKQNPCKGRTMPTRSCRRTFHFAYDQVNGNHVSIYGAGATQRKRSSEYLITQHKELSSTKHRPTIVQTGGAGGCQKQQATKTWTLISLESGEERREYTYKQGPLFVSRWIIKPGTFEQSFVAPLLDFENCIADKIDRGVNFIRKGIHFINKQHGTSIIKRYRQRNFVHA